jgi:multiple sugar transport system substrate-binding protein
MKKLLTLALASLLTASVALAQTTTLTVGLFEPLNEHLERVMDQFVAENPGVTLDIRTLGYGDHHDALVTYLATGSGAPDVVAIEIGYIARFVAEGGLRDLSAAPFDADQYEDQFVEYAWSQGRTADGRQIALPTDIGPGVMYYRRDHLETVGTTIEEVTASIDAYIDYGRALKQHNVFLIASAASAADALIRSDVPAGSGIYFDADGRPLLNSERFLAAARVAKTIRDEGLDAEIGSWSNEWYEAFRQGTTATELSGAWLGGHLQTWMAPETSGLWGASEIPDGRLLSWGGSFYGIPNQTPAEKLDLAWELVKFLTTRPDVQLAAFASINAFPAMPVTYDDPMFAEPLEFLAGQPARELFASVAERIPGVLTFPGDMVAQEIWNSALTEVLNEGRDIQSALDEAQSLVERRIRR